MALLRWSGSRFNPREFQTLSQPSECATKPLSLPAISVCHHRHTQRRLSYVKIQDRAMQAIRSCVAATVRRDWKEPVTSLTRSREERVIFRWRCFLLLTYLVVTASTAPTLPDDRGRDTGEEVAGRTGDTGASPCGRSGIQAKRRQELQQEAPTNFDTSNSKRRIGTIEATTTGTLACESVGLPACDRVKSVSGECSLGMDDVLVMRSSLESHDGPGRHSNEEGSGCDAAPLDASMSWLWKGDAVSTNIRQDGYVLRLQSVSLLQKGGARTTYSGFTCFSVCALVFGGITSRDSDNANGCRISQLGGQTASTWEVPAEQHQEHDFLLEQLQFLWSSGITGPKALRAILPLYTDQQKKVMVVHQVDKLQGTMAQK